MWERAAASVVVLAASSTTSDGGLGAILFLNPHPLIPDCVGIEGGCEGMPNREPVSSGYGLRTEVRDLRVSGHHDPEARVETPGIENPHSELKAIRRGGLQPLVQNPNWHHYTD